MGVAAAVMWTRWGALQFLVERLRAGGGGLS
jgi:hypothetical protein